MESILASIKKLLNVAVDDDHFDTDIIILINGVFMILTQLGVGPSEGFTIKDESAVWTDFVPDTTKIESVKTFIYLKVKLVFDPPSQTALLETIKETIKELEWRLNVAVDAVETN